MQPTFADLGVASDLVGVLDDRGITTAFAIQALTVPHALDGGDVCGKAPTGSGKTLAFGLPIVERVEKARPGRPKALVLAPTRELAAQIADELMPLAKRRRRWVAAFYGGVGFGAQLKALRKGVDIAVACPGRLADLIDRGDLRLDDVQIVVIDEADRMADMGFLPEVRRILDQTQPDRQTLLFSATLDGDVDVLIRNYQRNPERCEVVPEPVEDRTEHRFVETAREKRVELTASLVAEHGSTVVFCRTKHGADRLARQLVAHGVTAAAIHGDRSQSQRERALAAFAGRKVDALVATDVAARGIHVDDVGLVVHFDPPADEKDYVHRSGRTGRAGADGMVVLFVTDADRGKVKVLQRKLGFEKSGRAAPSGAASRAAAVPDRDGIRPMQPPRVKKDTWTDRAAPEERPESERRDRHERRDRWATEAPASGARRDWSTRRPGPSMDRPREERPFNRDDRPNRSRDARPFNRDDRPARSRDERPFNRDDRPVARREERPAPRRDDRPTFDRPRKPWDAPRDDRSGSPRGRVNRRTYGDRPKASEADRQLDAATRNGLTSGPRRAGRPVTNGFRTNGAGKPGGFQGQSNGNGKPGGFKAGGFGKPKGKPAPARKRGRP